jgi:hypothetical protein
LPFPAINTVAPDRRADIARHDAAANRARADSPLHANRVARGRL